MSRFDENTWLLMERVNIQTVAFRKVYVDICEGDLVAGLLLSQIMYWHTPNIETGREKLRVKKNGFTWLVKEREDWYEEVRITPSQFDRKLKKMIDIGIIEKKLFKFGKKNEKGEIVVSPTVHIRIIWDKFLSLLDQYFDDIDGGSDREQGGGSDREQGVVLNENRGGSEIEHHKEPLAEVVFNKTLKTDEPLGELVFNKTLKSNLTKCEKGISQNVKKEFNKTLKSLTEITNKDFKQKILNKDLNNKDQSINQKKEEIILPMHVQKKIQVIDGLMDKLLIINDLYSEFKDQKNFSDSYFIIAMEYANKPEVRNYEKAFRGCMVSMLVKAVEEVGLSKSVNRNERSHLEIVKDMNELFDQYEYICRLKYNNWNLKVAKDVNWSMQETVDKWIEKEEKNNFVVGV